MIWVFEVNFPNLTCCSLPVRKLVIHWQVGVGTLSWSSLLCSCPGMIVLKAELKTKNRILAYVPGC